MALSRRDIIGAAFAAVTLLGLSGLSAAQQNFITVASTTSTEQSGLFKHLLPVFEKKTGTQVRVVALGTGQALDMGRRGDADVVFVHDKVAEEKFVADGFGVQRFEVMYNDFVLVGPKADPAKIAGGKDIIDAYKKIAAAGAPPQHGDQAQHDESRRHGENDDVDELKTFHRLRAVHLVPPAPRERGV